MKAGEASCAAAGCGERAKHGSKAHAEWMTVLLHVSPRDALMREFCPTHAGAIKRAVGWEAFQ